MKNTITNLMIYERAKEEGRYMLDTKGTVRSTASKLNISKSTVYKDVTSVLEEHNDPLALEVKKLLEENGSVKHIRGGEATKRKYLQKNI